MLLVSEKLDAILFFFSTPAFGFRLRLLLLLLILLLHIHSPPTPSLLWSIRLSVHSQKWLWHLLKRPAECSGLKGYPMLWPKTARFLFFSLSLPSKSPLWHCALLCRLPDHSLNIFKLPPMKDFLLLSTLPHTHIQAWRRPCTHMPVSTRGTLRCKSRRDMKMNRCETATAAAVLHFRWGFNILWAHQRQHGWGESSGGQALQQENNYSTHHSGSTGGVRT